MLPTLLCLNYTKVPEDNPELEDLILLNLPKELKEPNNNLDNKDPLLMMSIEHIETLVFVNIY